MRVIDLEPFGVQIQNIDLKETQSLKFIYDLMLEKELVIVKNQNLSAQQWVHVCQSIGDVTQYKYYTHPHHPEIVMVTPEKKDGKSIGLFGKNELSWHTNGTARPNPEPGLGIYGHNPGPNSITSFANCHHAYEKLSSAEKEFFGNLQVRFKYQNNRFIDSDSNEASVLSKMGSGDSQGIIKPLCIKHPISQKIGLYWGVHYVDKILDLAEDKEKEIRERLNNICFSGTYTYHHHWENGDCIFADQLLTQHKRNAVPGERLVFRSVFHYKL